MSEQKRSPKRLEFFRLGPKGILTNKDKSNDRYNNTKFR